MSMVYPLEGYRVLDFGTAWAGPQVGQILADLGAEVIKIESRKKIDGARLGRPIVGDDIAGGDEGKWPDMQPVFHGLNRNKLSFSVDAKHPEGLNIIKQLVKISDVVSDNFSPGAMLRLNLDHKSLKEIKHDIISISLTAAGESGPLKNSLLYAPSIISLGGLGSLIGYYGENTPMQVMSAYGDASSSIHGAFAVLAALWHREVTGEGQHIELSESEGVTSLMGEAIMEYTMNGRSMSLQGNYHPAMSPHGTYPCKGKDRWISIAIETDEEWQRFCMAIGRAEWVNDARFADRYGRLVNRRELDGLVQSVTINYEPYELTEILQNVKVAAIPAMNIEDQYSDPHYRERKTYVEIQHPLIGMEILPGVPFRMSKTPGDIHRPAPSLGEHSQYVLSELLHLSPDTIKELVSQQIVY
jgi:benzylsuccinate CoA-transferase BbsF subunit